MLVGFRHRRPSTAASPHPRVTIRAIQRGANRATSTSPATKRERNLSERRRYNLDQSRALKVCAGLICRTEVLFEELDRHPMLIQCVNT